MSEPMDTTPIRTRLTRSNFCRTFRVDGAWGGITPHQGIHMALYCERWNTPSETTIRLQEGAITDLPDQEEERVLIREIEADVFMSEQTAVAVIAWLQGQVAKLREIRQTLGEVE